MVSEAEVQNQMMNVNVSKLTAMITSEMLRKYLPGKKENHVGGAH